MLIIILSVKVKNIIINIIFRRISHKINFYFLNNILLFINFKSIIKLFLIAFS